jgi:predicted transposase YbfD/YdcC
MLHGWPDLAAIGKVTQSREVNGKTRSETAYYLLSATVTSERFAQIVRSHRAIENSLHWCLNVVMNEDQARARMDNAPHSLAVLRHLALNTARKDTPQRLPPRQTQTRRLAQ